MTDWKYWTGTSMPNRVFRSRAGVACPTGDRHRLRETLAVTVRRRSPDGAHRQEGAQLNGAGRGALIGNASPPGRLSPKEALAIPGLRQSSRWRDEPAPWVRVALESGCGAVAKPEVGRCSSLRTLDGGSARSCSS